MKVSGPEIWAEQRFRWAAVLVLLVPVVDACAAAQPQDWRIVLTQRPQSMRHHGGQMAFPGGKWESSDESLRATALREAEEEIGVVPAQVEVLGSLGRVHTPSGFVIHPFVGVHAGVDSPAHIAQWGFSGEVEQLLAPRLQQLADPANYKNAGRGQWKGVDYVRHEYHVTEPPVWGATARMVHDLLLRMARAGVLKTPVK